MGLIDKIKIGAALALALGWFYVWLRIKWLSADNERLKQAAALAARESAAFKQEAEANRAALNQREKQRAELAAEKEALTDELEKTYAADPASGAWADAAVPDPVLGPAAEINPAQPPGRCRPRRFISRTYPSPKCAARPTAIW